MDQTEEKLIEIDADWMRFKALRRSMAAIEATCVMRDRVDQADKYTSLCDCLWAEYEAMSQQVEELWPARPRNGAPTMTTPDLESAQTCRHCGARIVARVEEGGDYPGDNVTWIGRSGDLCDPERSNQEHQPRIPPLFPNGAL